MRKAELTKAVKEVAADLLAEIGTDPVVGPDQRLRQGETAIYRNVLGNRTQRHEGCKRADRDEREKNFGSQSQAGQFLWYASLELCGTQSFLSSSTPAKSHVGGVVSL